MYSQLLQVGQASEHKGWELGDVVHADVTAEEETQDEMKGDTLDRRSLGNTRDGSIISNPTTLISFACCNLITALSTNSFMVI